MINALGGRKMIAATATVGVGIGVALYQGDVPDNLLTLLEFVFGSFAAANVANTVTGVFTGPKPAVDETIDVVEEASPEQPKMETPAAIPPQVIIEAFGSLQSTIAQVMDNHTIQNNQIIEQLGVLAKTGQVTQNAISMIIERISK